jgi:hypothetical protein
VNQNVVTVASRDNGRLDPHRHFAAERQMLLNRPEKFLSLSVLKEKAFSAAFLALALLAMTGWVYLLSSILLKFVLWCVDYFVQ